MALNPTQYENTERDWVRLVADIDERLIDLIVEGRDDAYLHQAVVDIITKPWPPNWREQLWDIFRESRISWLRTAV